MMRTRARGFTLIELMITLVILFLVMEAVTTFFLGWMRQYKQQSKIAESGVETLIGLEMLRRDIEHAGYGLPWNNIPGYNEAASGLLNDSPGGPPRAIVSVDNNAALSLNASDYLVVKAAAVGSSPVSRMWTTLLPGPTTRTWSDAAENLSGGDRVIVLEPGSTGTNWRSVVAGSFPTTFAGAAGFAGTDASQPRVIYGIDGPGGALRMPFNRAEYYVDDGTNAAIPSLCAPGTGMLVKTTVSHVDGTLGTRLPLLDCVASMHVIYFLDTDGDGQINLPPVNTIAALTAAQIREQLKEVRLFVLAQEGQRDRDYTHAPAAVFVGDPDSGVGGSYTLNASSNDATNQTHFRWKVHTLVVKPSNLQ